MNTKTVIITGGTSGIGKACAGHFAASGWNVVISGRNLEKLDKAVADLKQMNQQVTIAGVIADVTKEEDCRNLIQKSLDQFSRIDVLINNAGLSMRGLFADTQLSVLKTLMDTNFWGTVYCTKYALPALLESKGSVVGISSIAGKKGLPGRTGYSASKFAMEGFLETLRTENLNKSLHVLVACPGFTASAIRESSLGPDGKPQLESPRDETKMMQPEVVAAKIYHAIIHRKRDLVMTTNGKLTVLLNKFIPGYLDKVVFKYMSKESDSPLK